MRRVPRTAAGRALLVLAKAAEKDPNVWNIEGYMLAEALPNAVLAIEAEAAQLDVVALAEALAAADLNTRAPEAYLHTAEDLAAAYAKVQEAER